MKERRAAYLREGLRSRTAFWAMFGGAAFFIIEGASIRNPGLMLGGTALTALIVYVVAHWKAGKRAEEEFFAELAPQLGLSHAPAGHYPAITPLLSAGDRQRFGHSMEGPLFGKLGGPPCVLSHYTYDISHQVGEDTNVHRPNRFTVCAIDIGMPLWRFRGLYLRPRLSGLGLDNDWLNRGPKFAQVELESVRFNQLYEIRRAPDQDESAIRELFSPSFVVWLSEHPLQPGFECKAGSLVVFVRGHEQSAGRITLLHEAARDITRRLAKQVEEGGSTGPSHFSAAGQTIR